MTLVNHEGAAAHAADRIRRAGPTDAARMTTALAAAFEDDPVFRWFSPDDLRRASMLPGFFDVFVEAFMAHGETFTDTGVAGAALWSAPGVDPIAMEPAYAERLARIAGVDAGRLFEIVELFEAHAPEEPHHHLQFLGVRPARQGHGLGGRLMAPVLERCDRDGAAAYLEATTERSRALYARHGFRSRGTISLPAGPPVWAMWREPADR